MPPPNQLPTRRQQPETRRALDPETGAPLPRKQFLEGKLTYISLAITGAGAMARLFGWVLPAEEINGILSWIAAHYDELLSVIGLFGAAWGRLRINWRKEGGV